MKIFNLRWKGLRSIKRAEWSSENHIRTCKVTRQRPLLLNEYLRVVLGCVVLLCYLQQYGWAAASQIKEVRHSIRRAWLGTLENALLISEHLKATDQELMLEKVVNQSDAREIIWIKLD